MKIINKGQDDVIIFRYKGVYIGKILISELLFDKQLGRERVKLGFEFPMDYDVNSVKEDKKKFGVADERTRIRERITGFKEEKKAFREHTRSNHYRK